MTNSKITHRREQAQKAKKQKQVVIIGLLLVGLLIAFATQPNDDAPESGESVTGSLISLLPSPTPAQPTATVTKNAIFTNTVWKTDHKFEKYDLEFIMKNSLFFEEPVAAVISESEQERAPEGWVQAVYGSDTQQSAIVRRNPSRAEIIRTGQITPDGRRAVVNDRKGVKLVPPTNERASIDTVRSSAQIIRPNQNGSDNEKAPVSIK